MILDIDYNLKKEVWNYLKNNNIEEAIRFANKCASWVVTQKGVVVIDPTQI